MAAKITLGNSKRSSKGNSKPFQMRLGLLQLRYGVIYYLLCSVLFFVSWESYNSSILGLLLASVLITDLLYTLVLYIRWKLRRSFLWAWGLQLVAILSFIAYRAVENSPPQPESLSLLAQLYLHLDSLLFFLFLCTYVAALIYRFALGLSLSSYHGHLPSHELGHEKQKYSYLQASLSSIFAFFLFLALLNYVAATRDRVWDFSPGQLSLSSKAKTLLRSVHRPVHIYAFLPQLQAIPNQAKTNLYAPELHKIAGNIRAQLKQMALINSKIQVSFYNADLEALEIESEQRFGRVSNGLVIVRSHLSSISKKAEAASRLNSEGGRSPSEADFAERRLYFASEKDLGRFEKDICKAIVHVASPKKRIYFTTKNGEMHPFLGKQSETPGVQTLQDQLQFYNFELRELDILGSTVAADPSLPLSKQGPAIPKDADIVAILAPNIPFSQRLQSKILSYLASGASLFVSIDPLGKEDFTWLLEALEPLEQYRFQSSARNILTNTNFQQLLVSHRLQKHSITATLSSISNALIVLPYQGYFQRLHSPRNSTNRKAHAKPNSTDLSHLRELRPHILLYSPVNTYIDSNANQRKDPKEKLGEQVLALAYAPKQGDSPKKSSKLLIYAGSEWLSERGMRFAMRHHNALLASESFLWLAESPIAATLHEKEVPKRNILLTEQLKERLLLYGLLLFPVSMGIALGLLLYFYRRRVFRRVL